MQLYIIFIIETFMTFILVGSSGVKFSIYYTNMAGKCWLKVHKGHFRNDQSV